MLLDAVTLEESYADMLAKLAADGTKVVRYGRDSHAALVRAFRSIGLKILGPSETQLLVCAETIADRTRDALDAVQHLDAAQSDVELYRALLESPLDSLDASDRPGPPINLQSVVTRFKVGDVKLLFAGDMQFADPQVGDPRLRKELDKLRAAIRREAPFALAKLSHHGSPNAFNLDDLGDTPLVGICAGAESKDHPHRDVLQVLESAQDRLKWMRTDRNGLCTITFGARNPISLARGQISDPRPNTLDAPKWRQEQRTVRVVADHQPVEVVTRIPAGVRRVVVTIDVEPGRASRPGRRPIWFWPADVRCRTCCSSPTRTGWPRTSASPRRVARWTRSGPPGRPCSRTRPASAKPSTRASAASSSWAAMTSCPRSAATAFRKRCAPRWASPTTRTTSSSGPTTTTATTATARHRRFP